MMSAARPTANLGGRSAMVTGAGRGIGRACANALAAMGAKVHVVDLDTEAATMVADEVGGAVHIVDLADPTQIDLLPVEIEVLVNNAGLQHVAPVHEFPPDRFHHIQQVMLTAPFLLARRCLPHMYATGWGRIVHISSVHGLRASPYKAAYVAAKHGLEGLSKVIALEAAPYGVTSNCISPGYVRTALLAGQVADQAATHGVSPEQVVTDVLLRRSAIKRLIEADEVAALVGWLCGDQAGYLTGTSLPIDGGWSAS